MNYRRGDIVLVLFPDSNLRTSKRRPALVVQADQLGTGLGSDYRSDDYQQYGPCATPEQGSGAHQEQERERIGATDGFGDHDRQPRDHPRFGNRSGHRGIHRAERPGRSFTSNSGIVAGPSRSANRGGDTHEMDSNLCVGDTAMRTTLTPAPSELTRLPDAS